MFIITSELYWFNLSIYRPFRLNSCVYFHSRLCYFHHLIYRFHFSTVLNYNQSIDYWLKLWRSLLQWVYSSTSVHTGSVLSLSWTQDGTHLSGVEFIYCQLVEILSTMSVLQATASGAVVFAQLVDRVIQWNRFEAVLNENNQIVVTDVLNETNVRFFFGGVFKSCYQINFFHSSKPNNCFCEYYFGNRPNRRLVRRRTGV